VAGSSQMMACVERKDRCIYRSRRRVGQWEVSARLFTYQLVRCLTSSNRAQLATLYLRRPSVTRRLGWYCRPCSKRLKKGSVSTHASGLGNVNRPEHEVVAHGWGEQGCDVSDGGRTPLRSGPSAPPTANEVSAAAPVANSSMSVPARR
jgi:hypothetical protein